MKCKNCETELPNNATICTNCNTSVNEAVTKDSELENTQNQAPKAPINNNKKKVTIAIIAVAVCVALAIIGLLIKSVVMPKINYNNAGKAVEKEEYSKAISLYEKIPNYKDVSEKIDPVYFEYAKDLIEEEKYDEALSALEKTTNEEKEKYENLVKAILLYNQHDYDNAISSLMMLKDIDTAKIFLSKSYYEKAVMLYDKKDYVNARFNYQDAKNIKDVKIDGIEKEIEKCSFMIAESYFQDGELQKAQEEFEKLPKTYTVDGVKVENRLKLLNKYKDLVYLCTTWMGRNGKITVRQTHDSTGLWEEWTADYTNNIHVKCYLKENGEYKFECTANYYRYSNYSSISSALRTQELSTTFTATGKETLPTKFKSSSKYATLDFSNGSFNLKYDYIDDNYSMNFTYRYKSPISYGNHILSK